MTESGFSLDYEIYLNRRNEVRTVTSVSSLRILREMRRRDVTMTEVAARLNLSKSTVQVCIRKLLDAGIIASEPCIGDARSSVYHIDALTIFTSDRWEGWPVRARDVSMDRIIATGTCTRRECFAFYSVYLIETGLNLIPGLFNIGIVFARGLNDLRWWGRMFQSSSEQCAGSGISVEMNADEAFTLILRSDEDISDAPFMVVPMMGALCTYFRLFKGFNLSHELQLSVEDDGRLVWIHMDPFNGHVHDTEIRPVDSLGSMATSEPFAVYSVRGRAIVFTNLTMIGIMDALFRTDRTLDELESILGAPRPTIYTSLNRLISLGAVAMLSRRDASRVYSLSAEPLMYLSDPDPSGSNRCSEIVEGFRRGEIDYYSAVISYGLEASRCMGIRFDRMFMRSGRGTATALLESNPSMGPQDVVDAACIMIAEPDHAEVLSYLPIRIRIVRSKNSLWDPRPEDYIRGFIDSGLEMLLGETYPVSIETVYEEDGSN